jgi:UDP-N-acetylglucosamine diphosphorylase/glucosamine-1-phosphate N-acetyltransferase
VVIGNQAETVKEVVTSRYQVRFALQEKQLGTGHAVQCAIPSLPDHTEEVVILCGDVPLVRAGTLQDLIEDHTKAKRDVTVLSVEMADPSGYGRVVYDQNGGVCAIVEQADATEEQKKIRTINTGIYCVKSAFLTEALHLLDTNNQQGELYLTDIIHIGHEQGRTVGALVSTDYEEFIGINTQEDLQKVAGILANRGKSS